MREYYSNDDHDWFNNDTVWVRTDEKDGESYEAILFAPIYKTFGKIYKLSVNPNERWITKDMVLDFISADENEINEYDYIIGCVRYYGCVNFGGMFPYVSETKDEAIEYLKSLDIFVK